MWAFITSIVPLVLLLFEEFFSARARAREADAKFELDQANLKQIVDAAVEKWNAKNARDSQGASDAWDQADKEKGPEILP